MHLNKTKMRTKISRNMAVSAVIAAVVLAFPGAARAEETTTAQYEMQLDIHLNTMKSNLEKFPQDKNLADRLTLAEQLKEKADSCLELESVSNQNEIESLTAGISSAVGNLTGPAGWRESYYDCVNECLSLSENPDYYFGYYNISEYRKQLVDTALSCQGKIHYVWGEKPSSPEFTKQWEDGIGGLDCSGFVTWVYWHMNGGNEPDSRLLSTYSISKYVKEINHDELLPGDLGMITDEGTYYTDVNGTHFPTEEAAASSSKKIKEDVRKRLEAAQKENSPDSAAIQMPSGKDSVTHANHVGIYVGKDKDGNELWCHCAGGSKKTVVVNNYGNFHHYYRAISNKEEENWKNREAGQELY